MNCRTASILFCATILAATSPSYRNACPNRSLCKGPGCRPHSQSGGRRGSVPQVSRQQRRRRQKSGRLGAEQRGDDAPPAFKFNRRRRRGGTKPSKQKTISKTLWTI